MTSQNPQYELRLYVKELNREYETSQATEHSYRPALKNLLETLGGEGVKALNEPSHVECGAPDFIVEKNGVPIGHVECKDIGVNLDAVQVSEQLERYKDGLPNLILTDYIEFRWYRDGTLRYSARVGQLDGNYSIAFNKGQAKQIVSLLEEFFAAETPSVNSPSDLAKRMASKAKLMRISVYNVLAQEDGEGPLHSMLDAYREVLIKDLSPDDFSDLQAQTATYGLFAARCRHEAESGPFTRMSAIFAETTPFLRDVFGQIAGPGIDHRIAWIVDDLAFLLDRTDMSAILADFGSRAVEEDPVVHFYEDFLAAYDPKMREQRGVYYTPEPVVSYIVRSIDHLLRTRFNLTDGLADTERILTEVPGNKKEESPRILILDPAAGTGTFLREVVMFVKDEIEHKGLAGAWPEYVREHLLPRLFGFELLMAPYTICHLKLALELSGPDSQFVLPMGQRLNVFLTNTLEKPGEESSKQIVLMAHEIAREASGADAIKLEKPVMVVVGNPPYSGHSANEGVWIGELLRGKDGQLDTGSYFEVDGGPLIERNTKWLNDDYVKFIRFAQWRIESTGEGILGFVTNHSYLDSLTFRGMRQSLMNSFDEIFLLDLHGNSKKKEKTPEGGKDENVFDIQQGVAIGLFVKSENGGNEPARVFHSDLWGKREEVSKGGKYGWLATNDVESTPWTELTPHSPSYLFIPRDETLAQEYEAGWKLTEMFHTSSVGIVTARDKLTIQWTHAEMKQVADKFAQLSEDEARATFNLGDDVQDWKVSSAQEDIREHPDAGDHIRTILYRPFDKRYTYYTGKSRGFICRPRSEVMRHMISGPNLGLVASRQASVHGDYSHVLASRFIVDNRCIYSSRGIMYQFPLYSYPTEEQEHLGLGRQANFREGFVEAIGSSLSIECASNDTGDLQIHLEPEDIFHYMYAILYSLDYRLRYAEFLKSDFPRVPFTSNRSLFSSLVECGRTLTSLHTLESTGEEIPSFPNEGDHKIQKVQYIPPSNNAPGRVFVNPNQYFEGISLQTWEFSIGGYRPAEKWLKDRKGRTLSYDDIIHYRQICAALAGTPRIMTRIDKEIQKHGGWPIT